MLHHLEHRHHQEDDIDLSKQTRITVLQAALKRASGFPRRCGNGREIVRWGGKKKEKKEKKTKNSIPESRECIKSKRKVHQTEGASWKHGLKSRDHQELKYRQIIVIILASLIN